MTLPRVPRREARGDRSAEGTRANVPARAAVAESGEGGVAIVDVEPARGVPRQACATRCVIVARLVAPAGGRPARVAEEAVGRRGRHDGSVGACVLRMGVSSTPVVRGDRIRRGVPVRCVVMTPILRARLLFARVLLSRVVRRRVLRECVYFPRVPRTGVGASVDLRVTLLHRIGNVGEHVDASVCCVRRPISRRVRDDVPPSIDGGEPRVAQNASDIDAAGRDAERP
jgi:hypothetical protein